MVVVMSACVIIDTNEIMSLLVLLVSPESVGSILTGPGPLCEGDAALLTCNVTGGTALVWRNAQNFGIGEQLSPDSPSTSTVTVGGVLFTVTLLIPTSPHFVSQLSFTASADMNGEVVFCSSFSPSSGIAEDNITLQVESISKYLSICLLKLDTRC